MTKLEERLKETRKFAGLTQPQLAELIGVSRRTIINYEKDGSKAPVAVVKKIAHKCGVDEIWLLTGRGVMKASADTPQADLVRYPNPLKRFKNRDRAAILMEYLISIEALKPRLFSVAEGQIKILYDLAVEAQPEQNYFYMITEGPYQINHVFIGRTKNEVVTKARAMIDKWPEYEEMDNDKIIEMLEQDEAEFDLVKINARWPGEDFDRDYVIALYNRGIYGPL
jgi:transcriptional regulator with XRE-family HTH domain